MAMPLARRALFGGRFLSGVADFTITKVSGLNRSSAQGN
jgi:hypothetical protein